MDATGDATVPRPIDEALIVDCDSKRACGEWFHSIDVRGRFALAVGVVRPVSLSMSVSEPGSGVTVRDLSARPLRPYVCLGGGRGVKAGGDGEDTMVRDGLGKNVGETVKQSKPRPSGNCEGTTLASRVYVYCLRGWRGCEEVFVRLCVYAWMK